MNLKFNIQAGQYKQQCSELVDCVLLHKQILLHFSHELTELNPKVSMTDAKLYTRRIGVACNPNLALINHACDPNYGRVWIHSGPGNCCIF